MLWKIFLKIDLYISERYLVIEKLNKLRIIIYLFYIKIMQNYYFSY